MKRWILALVLAAALGAVTAPPAPAAQRLDQQLNAAANSYFGLILDGRLHQANQQYLSQCSGVVRRHTVAWNRSLAKRAQAHGYTINVVSSTVNSHGGHLAHLETNAPEGSRFAQMVRAMELGRAEERIPDSTWVRIYLEDRGYSVNRVVCS